MESTDARTQARTHTHAHMSTRPCTDSSANKHTYHHSPDCSARICQHYKTSNNWKNALRCTCNPPPTFLKNTENLKFNNRPKGLLSVLKNSNFSIYLSICFHLYSSLSLMVLTAFFPHVHQIMQTQQCVANTLICCCGYRFDAVLSGCL